MATITVKNIPNDIYERLKSVAEANRRSINSEIIVCIENAVMSRRLDTEAILTNARKMRQLTAQSPISEEKFNQAKAKGRNAVCIAD